MRNQIAPGRAEHFKGQIDLELARAFQIVHVATRAEDLFESVGADGAIHSGQKNPGRLGNVVLVEDGRVSVIRMSAGHSHPLDKRRQHNVGPLVDKLLDWSPLGVIRVLQLDLNAIKIKKRFEQIMSNSYLRAAHKVEESVKG